MDSPGEFYLPPLDLSLSVNIPPPDIILRVSGGGKVQDISANKQILAIESTYFRALLLGLFRETAAISSR